MFAGLGRVMYRWRRVVVLGWAVVVVAGGVLGGQIFDRTASVDSLGPEAEAVRAQLLIDERLDDGPELFAIARGRHPRDPALIESLITVAGELRDLAGVVEVRDDVTAPGGQTGADGFSYLVWVELSRTLDDAERAEVAQAVATVLRTIDAPQVLVGGEILAERAFAEQAIRDATIGESIALAVLVLVLVFVFGAALAALLPLLVALAAITATLLGLLAVTVFLPVGEFTINVVTLLGIGLAIDYAVLLIFRFREERQADPGAPVAEWTARAMATAGRAVFISGVAVAVAMIGLWLFAEPLLASMAMGGALVAVLATAIALTAVPALLGMAHQWIPGPDRQTWVRRLVAPVAHRLRERPAPGLLARLAGVAQRHPVLVMVSVSLGLLMLALPLLGANFANSDARALPPAMEARQAYDVLQRDFRADQAAPVVVLVDADAAEPAVRDLLNDFLVMPQVRQVQVRIDLPPGVTVVDLTPYGETGGTESRELVRTVRSMPAEVPLLVAGPAAEVVDFADSLVSRLPAVVAVLLVATMVLLFVLTGSLVIPVKALLLNLLTLLATLGILVAVFQWGVGSSLLGFESWGAIDLTTPVLLFVFLFALTMDYEVFLLSRIREEYDKGAGARSVIRGLTASGPAVTVAALCITIVFLGFVLGDLVAVKEIGVGMAVAILLDVTVVRGLLLPAIMTVLGRWNWWAPRFLRRWHPLPATHQGAAVPRRAPAPV